MMTTATTMLATAREINDDDDNGCKGKRNQ
jgi:hypothetical protein